MYFIKRPRVIIYNIVLVLCFVASVTFSSIAQSYTVSGNVISSEDNAQIEFATVKLLNVQDSSLYRAMYADSSGAFLFEEIDCNKSFVLKVAHIGYESLYKNSKSSVNCERIKFGALKLKIDRTLNLEEVKVQAQIDVLKAGSDDTASHLNLPGMLTDKLEVGEKVKSALEQLIQRTVNGDGSHSMPVCVICDQFIIGVEEVCSISKEILLKNKERLSWSTLESSLDRKLS